MHWLLLSLKFGAGNISLVSGRFVTQQVFHMAFFELTTSFRSINQDVRVLPGVEFLEKVLSAVSVYIWVFISLDFTLFCNISTILVYIRVFISLDFINRSSVNYSEKLMIALNWKTVTDPEAIPH